MSFVTDFLTRVLPAEQPSFRVTPVQAEYAASIAKALRGGRSQLHCIEGDTGIGKTLGYLLPAVEWLSAATPQRPRRVIIATHSRTLQRQLVQSSNQSIVDAFAKHYGMKPVRMALRMGRQNYVSVDRLMGILETDSLEAFADDEARPARERELARWASYSDGCLADLDDEALPAHIKLSDIAIAQHDPLPESLAEQFARCRAADILVTNHALLVGDLVRQGASLGATGSGVEEVCLIVDEGEHFAPTAEQNLSQAVSYSAVSRLAHELGYKANAEHWDSLLSSYTSRSHAGTADQLDDEHWHRLLDAIRAIRRTRKTDPDLSPAHAAWAGLRDRVDQLESTLNTQRADIVLSFSEVRGLPSLVVARPSAGSIIQNGADDRITIFTSATLSDLQGEDRTPRFRHLLGGLGLKEDDPSVGLCVRHEARDFGVMRFRLAIAAERPLAEADVGVELTASYARHAVREVTSNRNGRTLLLCASYRDVDRLDAHWPDIHRARVVTHGIGADLNAVANHMPANGILVTPAGWEGLSPERGDGPFWSRIVLLRSPTPPVSPSDVLVLANRLMERAASSRDEANRRARTILHARAKTEALQKIRQGLGRGLRHCDDAVEIVILDPRFRHDGYIEHGCLVGQAAAIPPRFQALFRSQIQSAALKNSPALIL